MIIEIDKIISKINPKYKYPIWENKMTYDTSAETLESVYFWIVDFISSLQYKEKDVEKLSDNFSAAPGSPYFASLSERAIRMQDESMKILGSVNMVIKSILNLVYDLKNFEKILIDYENYNGADPQKKEAALLGLKERWMNTVDAQRGMGSLNNMTHQYGFTTLRPAFMVAKSLDAADKMDLNEIVKNVLKPRLAEFFEWVKLSEEEIEKRFKIEKSYLKNQVDTLGLYTRWIKPYLKAAEQLRGGEVTSAALVSVFGYMVLELNLLAKKEIDVKDEAENKNLPERFTRIAGKLRKFYPCIFIDFKFRCYSTQQIPHPGRVDIGFKAYALNEEEYLLFKARLEEDDMKMLFGMAESLTQSSLLELQKDIDHFITKPSKEEKPKPRFFLAEIFSKQKAKKSEEEVEEEEKAKEKEKIKRLKNGIAPDTYEEEIVRAYTEYKAADSCFKIYDTFKKSKGMASFPNPFDELDVINVLRAKRKEIELELKKKELEAKLAAAKK